MGVRSLAGGGLSIAALVSSMLIAGCGGSGHSGGAAAVITRAANVSVGSGLKMEISVNEAVGGPGVIFTASGWFSPKLGQGSMTMYMQVPAPGGPPEPMRVVIANGTIYEHLPQQLASRIPGGKPWLSLRLNQLNTLAQLPGLFPFIRASLTFANPRQYLDFLDAAAAGNTSRIGAEVVNGVHTTRYRTAIDIANLPKGTPSVDRQAARQIAFVLSSRFHTSSLPVDVWIDRTRLIRRLQTRLHGSFDGQPVSVAITTNITRYGRMPVPTPPSAAQTTDLLSLVDAPPHGGG